MDYKSLNTGQNSFPLTTAFRKFVSPVTIHYSPNDANSTTVPEPSLSSEEDLQKDSHFRQYTRHVHSNIHRLGSPMGGGVSNGASLMNKRQDINPHDNLSSHQINHRGSTGFQMDQPIVGAAVIGGLFIGVILAVGITALIFCRKKNTVFTYRRPSSINSLSWRRSRGLDDDYYYDENDDDMCSLEMEEMNRNWSDYPSSYYYVPPSAMHPTGALAMNADNVALLRPFYYPNPRGLPRSDSRFSYNSIREFFMSHLGGWDTRQGVPLIPHASRGRRRCAPGLPKSHSCQSQFGRMKTSFSYNPINSSSVASNSSQKPVLVAHTNEKTPHHFDSFVNENNSFDCETYGNKSTSSSIKTSTRSSEKQMNRSVSFQDGAVCDNKVKPIPTSSLPNENPTCSSMSRPWNVNKKEELFKLPEETGQLKIKVSLDSRQRTVLYCAPPEPGSSHHQTHQDMFSTDIGLSVHNTTAVKAFSSNIHPVPSTSHSHLDTNECFEYQTQML